MMNRLLCALNAGCAVLNALHHSPAELTALCVFVSTYFLVEAIQESK